LGNYGPNKQLREFHRHFSYARDHKVGEAIFVGGGRITGYTYKCPTCDEFVERCGKGFRHEPRRIETARDRVNHGHNSWNTATGQWVADYQTWCPSCRAAQEAVAK
jgi:hypothetical protein